MDKAVVYTSFSVDDMEVAKHFYVDVLGYELGGEMTEYELKIKKDGQRVHIYPKIDHQPATYTLLNFKVENIETAVDELVKAGVMFEKYDNKYIKTDEKGIATRGTRKMAWFQDPAGNIHGLVQV